MTSPRAAPPTLRIPPLSLHGVPHLRPTTVDLDSLVGSQLALSHLTMSPTYRWLPTGVTVPSCRRRGLVGWDGLSFTSKLWGQGYDLPANKTTCLLDSALILRCILCLCWAWTPRFLKDGGGTGCDDGRDGLLRRLPFCSLRIERVDRTRSRTY